MKRTKIVQCAHCGANFVKSIITIEQEKKTNRQHFCSLSCVNDYNVSLVESIEKELKVFNHILSQVDTNPEKIKTSTDIDVLYLRTIWDGQGGRCLYSGTPLVLPNDRSAEADDVLYTAIIDKINPSADYVKGNIQFISIAMSYIKRDLSHEKTLKLVRLIKDN